jgi:hypothetical protein
MVEKSVFTPNSGCLSNSLISLVIHLYSLAEYTELLFFFE